MTDSNRGVVVAACVMSVLSILVAFIGVVIDGVGNTQIGSMETCASTTSYYATDEYVYYGNKAYDDATFVCIQTYYASDTDCYCVDSKSACFFLNGQTDCGVILSSYSTNLKAAIAMDVLCFVSVLAFSIVTCFSICCPYGFRKKKTSNFKNELKEDDRGSAIVNPLQNDKRPILERVATFGRMTSSLNFSSWNNSTSSTNDAASTGTSGGAATLTSESAAVDDSGSAKAKKGDVSSFVNPLAKKAAEKKAGGSENSTAESATTSTEQAAAAAAADGFSPSVAEQQFTDNKPPPPPPPPTKVSASPPPPPSATAAAAARFAPTAAGGGMSTNPLARKKVLPRTVSGVTSTNTATSEEVAAEVGAVGDGEE